MKKILLSVLGIMFVGVAGTLAWKALMPEGEVTASAVAFDLLAKPTKLVVTEGQATVKRAEADAVKVTTELAVQQGDVITVETTGKARIEWADGSVSRLNGGADMTVTKIAMDEMTGAQNAEVELRSGEMWTKVLNVVHDGSVMQVRSQNTVAGIRGTSVYTAVTATGLIMMPFEHAIEVRVGESETRQNLLEGEGLAVREGETTTLGSGTVMNAFILESQESDISYMTDLADARRAAFEMAVDASLKAEAVQTKEQFEKMLENISGSAEEQEKMLARQMDALLVKIIEARADADTVRLAELTELYEAMIPALEKATATNALVRASLERRVQLHMAVLLTDGVQDDVFLTRQGLLKVRFALLDMNDSAALLQVLRRELFVVADLAKAGKVRQVEELVALIRVQPAFQKPLLDTATDIEKDLLERLSARIRDAVPSMTGSLDNLRKQLTSTPAAEENSNENESDNGNTNGMEDEELPVVTTNVNAAPTAPVTTTPARQTNTNARTVTPTATTPKPTTPTPAPTTPVAPKPAPVETIKPAETLVPAPVKVTPTPVYRPVVTPAQ